MKNIILDIKLTDDLGIKKVEITNNTELKTDTELLGLIAHALLKAIAINEDTLAIQDMLSDLNIELPNS